MYAVMGPVGIPRTDQSIEPEKKQEIRESSRQALMLVSEYIVLVSYARRHQSELSNEFLSSRMGTGKGSICRIDWR